MTDNVNTMQPDQSTNQNSNGIPVTNMPVPEARLSKKIVFLIAAIAAVVLAGVVAWFVQQSKINKLEAKNKELQTTYSDIEKQIADYLGSNSTPQELDNVQAKARDIERQTDVKAIHSQVEAYYAQYGKYPALADLNSASWRNSNMRGLDEEALKDPQGSKSILALSPDKKVYSYDVAAPDNSACDNSTKDCTQYVLTATYENGGTFTKSNLN